MMLFATLDHLEYPILYEIYTFGKGTFIDTFSMILSNVPFMLIFFGIVILTLYVKKSFLWKPLVFALMVAILMHFLINEGFFKTILVYFDIFRPRPYTIHPEITPIGYQFLDSSFPSSHMAFTTLMVIIVTYFHRSFATFGIFIIILMGFSRIHNGMHYPSDVFLGIGMGFLYALSGIYLMKKTGLEKKSWWRKIIAHIS